MKTTHTNRQRQFKLTVAYYGSYTDQVHRLEAALAKKPREIQIELIGSGEIPADSALLIRSVLRRRSPNTRVITNARSSLLNGTVLVWLMGDTRIIREDAQIFFRALTTLDVDLEGEEWKQDEPRPSLELSCCDLEESDYATVLRLINEFLPVKELAGRTVPVSVLKQFGLVDSENVDRFLAAAFGKPDVQPVETQPHAPAKPVQPAQPLSIHRKRK